MSNSWYYADAGGRQVGPISADELRAAVRRGAAGATTLAWREGLAEWTPLSKLADELHLELGAAPPSSAPAPPPLQSAAAAANPYRAPEVSPELMVRAGAGEVVYAGFWRRFAARFLDHLVVIIPLYVVLMVVAVVTGALSRVQTGDSAMGGLVAGFYIVLFAANFLYFSTMESSAWQATVGKMALGIKVTDADGRRLDWGRAALRWFAAALSYLTIYIGFIMAGFTEQKRALHDMLASTLVVDKWAYTDTPEKQSQGMSGCLIVFIVFVVFGLFIVPILAAISISQYQDYVIRSQVSEGAALADGVKTAYAEYVSNHDGAAPPANADAGLAAPASIHGAYASAVEVRPGGIVVSYSSMPPTHANQKLDGKHLNFSANVNSGSIEWTCSSSELQQKWCPSACRCSGYH